MLAANHALLSNSSSDPCNLPSLTSCDFLSASHRYTMSHVPSMPLNDLKSSSAALSPSPIAGDSVDLISFERSAQQESPQPLQDEAANDFSEQMIAASHFAKLTAELCRNKRKNFQPRCRPEDEEDTETIPSDSKEPSSGSTSIELSNVKQANLAGPESTLKVTERSASPSPAPSSPTMAESIFNEFISNLSSQAVASNGKLEQQPLDLSNQEQLQQQKQLAELLFLKNIRNISMFYPHLSPHMFMQSSDGKLPADSASGSAASETKEEGTSENLAVSAPPEQAEMEASDSSPIEQLLHLYGFNRDLYLKALQQARNSQESSEQSAELASLTRNEESDQESQTSPQESLNRGGLGDDLTMETSVDGKADSSKGIDIEKLKQLQDLYKLNLIQQQMEQSNECKALSEPLASASLADSTNVFSSLDNSFHKLPPESMSSLTKPVATSSVALSDNYFGDIFKSKASNKPSRRPLSSWKQSISACGPGPAPWVDKTTLYSLGIPGELINKSVPIDYTHYVKRYGNAAECGNSLCKELNYREHFHCNAMSCNSRVFMKKEEMIRHFKWHKKRDESLTHGFLRCSPADNCVERFRNCPHHRKQTHYHCLKRGCDKVYISTSDVQMHANYHRKDTAIIQEGFQRFRATENCLLETCAFFGQKTTHFHCRRDNCNHTFKNKADMEKHKSYHIRDEQLARDGFKKFMKHEACTFDDCRSSRVCNHIHCIRPGCSHVLHSTGQLYPHKRKHERRENELAYRKYRLAQSIYRAANGTSNGSGAINLDMGIHETFDHLPEDDATLDTLAAQLPLAQVSTIPIEDILGEIAESRYLKYIHRHTCGSHQCHFELSTNSLDEHYCCVHCSLCWLDYPHAIDHAKKHVIQEEATRLMLEETTDVNVCTSECTLNQNARHYHCRMFGCSFAIPIQEKSLRKLEHYKFHEEQQRQFVQSQDSGQRNSAANTHNMAASGEVLSIEQLLQVKASQLSQLQTNSKVNEVKRTSPTLQVFPTGTTLTSVDGLPVLKRKRGRPPKNRSNEILSMHSRGMQASAAPNSSSPFAPLGPMSSFDLAAAFNLPLKHANVISSIQKSTDDSSKTIPIPLIMPYLRSSIQNGFYVFDEETPCPDLTCVFFGQKHFHCSKPRCYFSVNREEVLTLHSRDFHDNIDIMEGFVYFDENIDCKLATCSSNKAHKHFHCTRVGCTFSFVHYSLMCAHEEKHRTEVESQNALAKRRKYSDALEDEMANSPGPEDINFPANSQLFLNAGHDSHLSEEFYSMLRARKEEAEDGESVDSEQLKGNFSMIYSLQNWFQEQAKMNALTALAGVSAEKSNQEANQQHHMMYSEAHPCNSPFCKLKRKSHFHCNTCNQAFSSFERLVPHSMKHHGLPPPVPVYAHSTPSNETGSSDQGEFEDGQDDSRVESEEQRLLMANLQSQFAQNPNLANHFLQILMSNWMSLPASTSSPNANNMLPYQLGQSAESPPSANMFVNNDNHSTQQRRSSFSSDGSTNEYLKKVKADDESSNGDASNKSSSLKAAKGPFAEESSPKGYLRFRFNEDCGFSGCVYREHQTHFHCIRKDCGYYTFCDRSRFVQHTARHERLDSLMGGDFRQFRSSVSCGQPNCPFANVNSSAGNKTSHFHCLKCPYVCADTNKVVAHRRQHGKMDSITANGFEKFAPTQDCQKDTCNYKLKQTHYHCVTCNYSVLGLTGMSSHKQKHQQQQSE